MYNFDDFKKNIASSLICPSCSSQQPLEIRQGTPITKFSGQLHTEYLTCFECHSHYPITFDYIPILFTPEIQEELSDGGNPSSLSANINIYDEISDSYDAFSRKSTSIGERMRFAVKNGQSRCYLNHDEGRPPFHLDFGCGPGHVLGWLKECDFVQIGMDVSLKNLRNARKNTGAFVICGDACRMPFANETFDVVTESSVLHHIEDWKTALKEATRVCAKSGRIIIDSEPSQAQMAWSRFAIAVFDLRFPIYKLLSYIMPSKYIFRDTEKAKLNLLAEIHHQPGTGFPLDELKNIFLKGGFNVKVVQSPTIELLTKANPGWKSIVLNLLSFRNPWNPEYGAFIAIGFSNKSEM